MNNKFLGFGVIVVFLAAPIAAIAQVTILDYQGAAFTNVTVSGNTTFPDVLTLPSVEGDVTLSAPLAANLNSATVVPVSFSFNPFLLNTDIYQHICCGSASFVFSTNNAGAITGWNVDLSLTIAGTNSPSSNTIVLGPSGDTYSGWGSYGSCNNPQGCYGGLQESNTTPGVWTTQAPEIDPASAASGLTLLLGGLAVLRGRRKLES
jgi:hypothetical protein